MMHAFCLMMQPQTILSLTFIEALSEAIKLLKAEYLVKAIDKHKMDQAIIFCRTKLDCDNIENYLISLGGGMYRLLARLLTRLLTCTYGTLVFIFPSWYCVTLCL